MNEQDGPSMGHLHVAAQTRGSTSLLHSLSLVFGASLRQLNEQDGPSLYQGLRCAS